VLERLVPGVPVQGEEGGGVTTGTRWVVDPLDGTTNFVHDYPFYCVSIALCEGPRPLVGCIVDPIRDRVYVASRGNGCRIDGEPARVSEVRRLGEALGVTGFPANGRERARFLLTFVERALHTSHGMRRSGSAAMDLAMIAAANADFYWEFGLHPWDTAAGAVLVEEAGGRVTTVPGGPWDPDSASVLATNAWVHDEVVAAFADLLEAAG
jgi:myo-inositol-1(or 4)-monophosphatase